MSLIAIVMRRPTFGNTGFRLSRFYGFISPYFACSTIKFRSIAPPGANASHRMVSVMTYLTDQSVWPFNALTVSPIARIADRTLGVLAE
jgi:hypothetical protein